MRAILTRRWLVFALTIVAFAYLTFRLGEWQFQRLEDRRVRNDRFEANLSSPPAEAAALMPVDASPAESDEWRSVRATGSYDPAGTVIVRYQTRDGALGVDVVTPLVLADGTAVLVDRGWLAGDRGDTPTPPPPPAGSVEVTGWLRLDGTGDSTKVANGSTRAINSEAIGATLDYPVRQGFVDLQSQTPAGDTTLVPAERPDLGEGPHFFYGLQWWFFGLLSVGGFFYLFWDERRKNRLQRAEQTAVDGEGGTADE